MVSFPPPTKMLPFGGFPLREGALDSEESGGKSHSGIPGSKAACAYPGHIAACRALRQLSSLAILQTAWHVGPFGGVYWRLVKTFFLLCASLLPVHGVILSSAFFWRFSSPFASHPCGCGVASIFDGVFYVAGLF